MPRRSPWRSLKTRIILSTSVLWLAGLWGVAAIAGGWLLSDLRELLSRNHVSSAVLVADQVQRQVAERLEALQSVAAQISPELLRSPGGLQAFLLDKPILSVLFNAGAYVADGTATARASVPVSVNRLGLNYGTRDHVRRALDQGFSSVGEIVTGKALNRPVFSMAAPIRDSSNRIIGCVVGVIDLEHPNFLDNISNNSLGNTGGYLLVSRNQRLIVTASDKKRIMEKLPPQGAIPSIDFFLEGGQGSRVLTNPRGVEVLVGVHQVALAPWYVAVLTPTAEAFRPVFDTQVRLLWLALAVALLTGILNWIYLRHLLSPVMKAIQDLSTVNVASESIRPLENPRKDEVGDLIDNFNRLLAALEGRERERIRYESLVNRSQRLEALGLLAGGIAHDFNNLLASVFGNIELALLKSGDGPASVHLHKTLGALGRAKGLTQQLLTFSKGGAPELAVGSLFPFVEETARFALSGSTVNFQVDAEPELRPCRFDRNQLGQVIENLVINALQAMPSGGTITLGARNIDEGEGRLVRISVSDTGQGMSAETLTHLFEPFFTTKAAGHGLGLTTCYSILKKHGGDIEVKSELGRGTTFFLTLPACDLKPEPMENAPTQVSAGSGLILVMDDEAPVGEVLEEMLLSLGYGVIRTSNGDEAVHRFNQDRRGDRLIRAAILDLTVRGGKGGQETLQELRRLDSGLPVLVASGFAEAPILTDPKAFGFEAALRKPYRRSELETALQRVLAQ